MVRNQAPALFKWVMANVPPVVFAAVIITVCWIFVSKKYGKFPVLLGLGITLVLLPIWGTILGLIPGAESSVVLWLASGAVFTFMGGVLIGVALEERREASIREPVH